MLCLCFPYYYVIIEFLTPSFVVLFSLVVAVLWVHTLMLAKSSCGTSKKVEMGDAFHLVFLFIISWKIKCSGYELGFPLTIGFGTTTESYLRFEVNNFGNLVTYYLWSLKVKHEFIFETFEYFIPLLWIKYMRVFMILKWCNIELCNILVIIHIISI